MGAKLLSLLLSIAAEQQVPESILISIAMVENPRGNAYAINHNTNGTIDRGIMQLNSSWYTSDRWHEPEHNIRAAARHLRWLKSQGLSWYDVAVAYNAGLGRVRKPPRASVNYADRVFEHVRTFYERRC